MRVLGNTPNFYSANQTHFNPSAKANQSKALNFSGTTDRFQFSNKSKALTFQGAHKSVVDQDGKDLGAEAAEQEQWGPNATSDTALQGKVESDPLRNGTSYFFTQFHKGLYAYEKQHAAGREVKPARIEWIAGLSNDEASQIYADSKESQG